MDHERLESVSTAPLAFLDIDGVLNRDINRSAASRAGYMVRHLSPLGFHRVRVILDPQDTQRLHRLATAGIELAWGTTWEHEANELISPLLGLPQDLLVAVNTGMSPSKAAGIIRAAAGRTFVWFDDEASVADAVMIQHAGGTLITVDPHTGLTDTHIKTALQMLAPSGMACRCP